MGDGLATTKVTIKEYVDLNHSGKMDAGDLVIVDVGGYKQTMFFDEFDENMTQTKLPNGDTYVDANGNGLMDKGDWVVVDWPRGTQTLYTAAAYLALQGFTRYVWKSGTPGAIKNLSDYLETIQMVDKRYNGNYDMDERKDLFIKAKAGSLTPAEKVRYQEMLEPPSEKHDGTTI